MKNASNAPLIAPATLQRVKEELYSANQKHPGPHGPGLAILTEEVGELSEALLKHDLEPTQERKEHVSKEAIQVIAMAIQLYEEGDETLGWYGAYREDVS